jgi:hypothetical protein
MESVKWPLRRADQVPGAGMIRRCPGLKDGKKRGSGGINYAIVFSSHPSVNWPLRQAHHALEADLIRQGSSMEDKKRGATSHEGSRGKKLRN